MHGKKAKTMSNQVYVWLLFYIKEKYLFYTTNSNVSMYICRLSQITYNTNTTGTLTGIYSWTIGDLSAECSLFPLPTKRQK